MKLAIFGATGKTGQLLVKQALERGYQVTAFTRSPEKLRASGGPLNVVQGDVRDADKVKEAVVEAEAVLSVLGPTENKPLFTVSQGTRHILDAMREYGIERLIVSAGAGVNVPEDDPKLINLLINFLLKLASRWVYEDMKRTVEIVQNSDVKWTVVRGPRLTDDEPTGEVFAGYVGKGLGMRITRADLARFMLDQVGNDEFIHKAPAISS